MKIFVTGIGVVSAIGFDVEQNLQSLLSGLTGIRRSDELGLMLGEVKITNDAISNKFKLPKEDFSRTSLLALVAAKEAWGENKQNAQGTIRNDIRYFSGRIGSNGEILRSISQRGGFKYSETYDA